MAVQGSGDGAIDRLICGYALQGDIYRSLLDVARQQGALLEQGRDVDRCSALFERKDALLRSLVAVEQDIEPLKHRWWTEEIEPSIRQCLNDLLDSILGTIEDIMAQEERNEALLLARQREVQGELARVQRRAAPRRSPRQAPGPQGHGAPPRLTDVRH